jgi:hypothetical protein
VEYLDCQVTWTPRGGSEPRTITGDFVNNWEVPTLACGLGEILNALGHVVTETAYARVQTLVNAQLSQRPWADITCPSGTARLELI